MSEAADSATAVTTGVVAQLLSLVLTDGIESELSATEWLLVDAMRGGGGVARLRHTLDALEEAGLARGTAAVCLGRSPLFRRVERGVWALAVGSAA